jgi:hypothetical protein
MQHCIGYMAGMTEMPLGGSNAIELWFGRKEYYWAFALYLKHFTFTGHR